MLSQSTPFNKNTEAEVNIYRRYTRSRQYANRHSQSSLLKKELPVEPPSTLYLCDTELALSMSEKYFVASNNRRPVAIFANWVMNSRKIFVPASKCVINSLKISKKTDTLCASNDFRYELTPLAHRSDNACVHAKSSSSNRPAWRSSIRWSSSATSLSVSVLSLRCNASKFSFKLRIALVDCALKDAQKWCLCRSPPFLLPEPSDGHSWYRSPTLSEPFYSSKLQSVQSGQP